VISIERERDGGRPLGLKISIFIYVKQQNIYEGKTMGLDSHIDEKERKKE
jgi:hypothetical protein